jgi:hypothetical protein
MTLDSYSIAPKGEEGEIGETRLKTGNTGREHPSTISLALTFMLAYMPSCLNRASTCILAAELDELTHFLNSF